MAIFAGVAAPYPDRDHFIEHLDAESYVATMRPNHPALAPGLLFCVFWDFFLVVWYGTVLSSHSWSSAAFGLGHLAVGVWLTHAVLVAIFNVRTLRIGDGRIVFRSRPIPFGGRLDVAMDDVDRFEAVERKTRRSSVHVVVVNMKNGTSSRIDVVTTDPDGTRRIAESFNEALAHIRVNQPRMPAYRG
jgi:hypothetical protein